MACHLVRLHIYAARDLVRWILIVVSVQLPPKVSALFSHISRLNSFRICIFGCLFITLCIASSLYHNRYEVRINIFDSVAVKSPASPRFTANEGD